MAESDELIPTPFPLEPYAPLVDKGGSRRVRDYTTGLSKAVFPCTYCPYIGLCHGQFEKQWEAGKPVFTFKQEK